jgi:hypothetical protein
MARKRMINPTIWDDPNFVSMTTTARLLFIGLFSNADDEGRIRGNAAYLKKTIFGYDNISVKQIEKIRNEVICKIKNVVLYKYIELKKWDVYQKLREDRIQKSDLPSSRSGQVVDISPPSVGQLPAEDRIGKDRLGKDRIGKSLELAAPVPPSQTLNDITFVFSIFKQHFGVSPTPIKAKNNNFDLNAAAAKRLVKVHGREKLKKMLELVFQYQNTEKYFKICTNPLEFEKNYTWYKIHFEQKKLTTEKRKALKANE